MRIRIGTRRSMLALAQTRTVIDLLAAAHPHLRIDTVPIATRADRHPTTPLPQLPAKALFTAELAQALDQGRIDLAVHSAKDLPTDMAASLCIACVPPRLDPADALVSDIAADLLDLPRAATVGTSSLRRAAQLLALRPDLQIVAIRGNIETRIEKVHAGQYHATLLAAAGLARAGLIQHACQIIPTDLILPAPGQAALAVQVRRDRHDLIDLLAAINDEPSAIELAAERLIAARLGASCHTPLGALARADKHYLTLTATLLKPDGTHFCRAREAGPVDQLDELVERLLTELHRQGAGRILASSP